MKAKDRFFVDNFNRLNINRKRKLISADGRFSIDKNNRLTYWLNEPSAWRKKYSLPSKISFAGSWKINSNYDLELYLDKDKYKTANNPLLLRGEVISADSNSLAFEINTSNKDGSTHIQVIKLSGWWQADEFNRISFAVKKNPDPGVTTLCGTWKLNRNQQIAYAYEKTDLKRKTRITRSFSFEGFWQINESNKLAYIFSHNPDSRFEFRVQLESPNLYPQDKTIKYRLGIGIKGKKGYEDKVISLYGAWKFNRKLGLVFEMQYSRGQLHSIEFGADISLGERDKIILELRNSSGEPLGINMTLSHRFLNSDAEAFLKLKALRRETAVLAGMRIPF